MKIESVSFREYPFSKLFHDYLSGSNKVSEYFEYDPFSDEALNQRINNLQYHNDRKEVVNVLKNFNKRFDAAGETFDSIDKLIDEKTVTVVTGQQMILYGGPLFTIYKIMTVIHTARNMEQKLNRSVVPVFWLADEDHDYKEAATISLPSRDEHHRLFYDSPAGSEKRVSDIKTESDFSEFRNQLNDLLQDTEFTPDLWDLLNDCYAEGEFMGVSFGKLLLKIFGKYGLILAGSNDIEIKQFLKEPLAQSIRSATSIESVLQDTSQNLIQNGYHSQVNVQRSNLFWIDDGNKRKKIQSDNNRWFVDDSKKEWTSDELIQHIKTEPESFSPNVFLRPVVQNFLLPVVAYIAGPGEIAYYAQMRRLYHQFSLHMPLIIPRFSLTILESPIARIVDKLPFQIPEYVNRIEDLEKMYIKRSDSPDIESIFRDWKSTVSEASKGQVKKVSDIDPTLKKSADKTVSQFFTELDKLKGKLYRSVKDNEKIQLNRIQKIQNHLFPDMNLQEREVAFIYIMNRYGIEIWDRFIEQLKDHEPNSHKHLFL